MSEKKVDIMLAGMVSRFIRSSLERSSVSWRHHKIGVLQAYAVEEDQPGDAEVRVHVWHPALCLANEDSGRIHDHRARITSRVLVGAIFDAEIGLVASEDGTHRVWNVQNARSAVADGSFWVKRENLDRRFDLMRCEHRYGPGAGYSYAPRMFHRSEVEDLTVTVVSKTEQSTEPARIVARDGQTPKHAFDTTSAHGVLDVAHMAMLLEAADRLDFIVRKGG